MLLYIYVEIFLFCLNISLLYYVLYRIETTTIIPIVTFYANRLIMEHQQIFLLLHEHCNTTGCCIRVRLHLVINCTNGTKELVYYQLYNFEKYFEFDMIARNLCRKPKCLYREFQIQFSYIVFHSLLPISKKCYQGLVSQENKTNIK